MRTSLYSPIFINPQAYYVFPQLYDVEPDTKSFIEQAVFAGTLIVQSSDDTLVRYYSDTKVIDLSEFANKTITISQATNIGTTVLGQWKIISEFNPSLVDAWFMSGYSNSDKPKEIVGVRGNAIELKNFLYSDESGFNEVDGSLMFDGVDDYGIWEGKPLLTDFTIICKREWVDPTKIIDTSLASTRKSNPTSDGAFAFEKISQGTSGYAPRSFGDPTNVPTLIKTGVTYMTPTDYNGTEIIKGGSSDNDLLLLGAGLKDTSTNQIKEFFNGSIYYFALYNKSLSPQVIEEEKIKLEQKWKSKLK